MLNLNQFIEAQKAGESAMVSLNDDETAVMMVYANMAAAEVIKMGRQKGAPVMDLVTNAFRNGICLGSQITIEKNQAMRRDS